MQIPVAYIDGNNHQWAAPVNGMKITPHQLADWIVKNKNAK